MRVYSAIERYWLGNPIWMPFLVVILLPIFLAVKPGMLGYIIGTHVDSASLKVVNGTFERRSSTFTPYKFRTTGGQPLSLACQVRERFVTCLDKQSIYGFPVEVTFAPSSVSSIHEPDGIIEKVTLNGVKLFPEEGSKTRVKLSLVEQIVISCLHLIVWLCGAILAVMAVFIGIGWVTSLKRIFGINLAQP